MFAYNKKVFFLFLILVFILIDIEYAQYIPSKERGDIRFRRSAHMEGNQIRTTIFNYGMTGRESGAFPISVQTPYEWPKNTGQIYLAVAGIVVGAEVMDDNGDIQHIISRCHYLQSPQGLTWNFEPVPGYFNEQNPEGFATSNDPTTWPSSWPDKSGDPDDPGWPGTWNGYFGKNVFNADQEMFFRASDNNYDRYPFYFPDTTDLTRKGLGLILDTRVMAWSQILVQDAMFLLFKIKNDGTKPLNKVGVTITWADFVGEDGQDDISEFDILNDIIWSRDADNRSPVPAFGSDPVGIVGGALLETPGNAIDRIDNDGDGETGGPKVTDALLAGESDSLIILDDPRRSDGIDNNGNGLIDENATHIAFQDQLGVTYADRIDQNLNAETGSPVVTQEMVNQSAGDRWKRWPPNPETDPVQNGAVHLIMVESEDVGRAFTDFIDNDDDGEENSPVVSLEMITTAAADAYFRYKVPGTNIILYNVKTEDLGKKYADGIDNDDNGAVDEFMDEGIDEMVDESRNNGIDDDGDWNPATDDVGLDGLAETGDEGENDGKPTSGARFGLPGEPGVDVTDVAETDQIGITGSFYRPSSEGLSDQYTDNFVWANFMVPGNFFDPANTVAGEYNLFVSSGLFPLQPGQTEPISLGIILANGPVIDPDGQIRKQAVLDKKVRAQETYNNDYQFANSPFIPKLTAIPGDNRVTLYWDDAAEESFDRYIDKIGGIGNDFEGYRIYRASDPAFLDAKVITNATGTPTFLLPIKQFDLEDGIVGFDSVGFEGVHFGLGNDSGLEHSWVDSSVQNGFTYYYAITSYDFGYTAGGISPAECKISISLNPDGTVKTLGKNVAHVTPEAPSAGYVAPTLGDIAHIEGTSAGTIVYEIIDVTEIKEGHVYRVTFEDTLIVTPNKPDTLKTKNFTLTDSTDSNILLNKKTNFDVEQPIIDGFRLSFTNESIVQLNRERSRWTNSNIPAFKFEKFNELVNFTFNIKGEERINDYAIIFGERGIATSRELTLYTPTSSKTYPPKQVNFKVVNLTTGVDVEFGFEENDSSAASGGPGYFSTGGTPIKKDRIVFLEPEADSLTYTWMFYMDDSPDSSQRAPQPNDTAFVYISKPFLSNDVFRFVSKKGAVNLDQAKADLEKIKVVPNPYLANAKWEIKNPYSSGRGPRSIHFTHLPNSCTIRIFTVNGELVKEIVHESNLIDGSEEWDLLTKDNLSAAYGVYIYHIDAPGIGTTVGKLAIIK